MRARDPEQVKSNVERITVGLIPKVSNDLAVLSRSTGLSKTDLVNRALTVLKLVLDKQDQGYRIAFIGPDQPDGRPAHAEYVVIT